MNKLSAFFQSISSRYLIVCGAVVLFSLFLPSILYGVREAHDIRFHVTWYLSFQEAFSLHNLYPKWFADEFMGLGAPTLLLYPPLTNYFYNLIDLLTFRSIPVDRLIGLSGFFIAGISALTFYAWIKNFLNKNAAIIGALLYAIAPYHLMIDFYNRGAMAEFAAYMWVPLIFTSLYHIIENNQRHWFAVLSLSLAALFFTHLLTALIVAPAAIIYALILLKKTSEKIEKIGLLSVGGILGLGIAAIYLVPALTMMGELNTDALHRFSLDGSFIYKAITEPSVKDHFLFKIFVIGSGYLGACFYILGENISRRRFTTASLFTIIGFITYLLMCGVGKFIFLDPSPYKEIQFPWRLMVLMEFSTLTAAAMLIGHDIKSALRPCIALGVLFSLLMAFGAGDIANRALKNRHAPSILQSESVKARLSSEEYLPKGSAYPIGVDMIPKLPPANKSLVTLLNGKAKIISVSQNGDNFRIEIEAKEPSTLSLRQFYFPGWVAYGENKQKLDLEAVGADHLVGFSVPDGHQTVTIYRETLPQEKIGAMISLASLLLLGAFTLLLDRIFFLYERFKDRLHEIIRFGIVGGGATVTHMVVALTLSTKTALPLVLINVMAFAVAFGISFFGHYHWTFRAETSKRESFAKFLSVGLIGLGASTALLSLLIHLNISTDIVKLLVSIFIIPIVTYILSKTWAFRAPKEI